MNDNVNRCPLCGSEMIKMLGSGGYYHLQFENGDGTDCILRGVKVPREGIEAWNKLITGPEEPEGAEPSLDTLHVKRCVSAFLFGMSTVTRGRIGALALSLAEDRDKIRASTFEEVGEAFEMHCTTHGSEVEAFYDWFLDAQEQAMTW